jgi:hypothetical protein
MPGVVAKNTFLSLVADDGKQAQAPQRSRSAEITRTMPSADAQHELTRPSLKRLNAVLEMGLSGSATQPTPSKAEMAPSECQESEHGTAEGCLAQPPNGAGLSDLIALQGMLGKALAEQSSLIHHQASRKLTDEVSRFCRAASDGSVSTMATSRSMSALVSDSSDDDVIGRGAADRRTLWPKVQQKPTSTGHAGRACGQGRVGRSQTLSRGDSWADVQDTASSQDAPTTMMIRNLPRRYSQPDLMMDLEELGFAGTFDFLYIPIDKATSACMGYAFVNFKDSDSAESCMRDFHDYVFKRQQRGSSKVACVSVAHVQGLEKNMQHYKNSAVHGSKHKMQHPVLLTSMPTMTM